MAITDRYEIPETEIHDLLRNERRQQVIKQLQDSVGTMNLRELAELIAEYETDESPPPRNIRKSVYNSLHQTHLPKLDQRGIVDYESDRKEIRLTEDARSVNKYMEVVTPWGVTWDEYYSTVGTLSLTVVLAGLIGVPVVSAVDPVFWVSVFLAVFCLSIGYQLWTNRWIYFNALFN